MEILFFILLPVFFALVMWLGYRILQKAGIDGRWVWVLLIPIVNIVMVWAFAFTRWPNLRADVKQDF